MKQGQIGKQPQRVIARRMAIGFGLVSVVAVLMCGILITLINQVSGHVNGMRMDEVAIKESQALANLIREQYIHQAHWIIEQNDDHLHHYSDRLEDVERRISALEPLVPEQRELLKGVASDSAELDRLFRDEIVPAVKEVAHSKVITLHTKADTLSTRAASAADVIASSVEQRMAHAHMSATSATTRGLITGAVCVFLVVVLSVMFTIRLRRSVLTPLNVLANAARRFGAGDFKSRVGAIGEGELLSVSNAFDSMADELETRERLLIENERMAAIGQLAAGVAHEINNPIQVIRGYLKTMTPDSPRTTIDEELLILDEEAAACQRIAEDLVTYSRFPDLVCDYVNMQDLLVETVRRFRETPEGSEQHVEIQAAETKVWADSSRLRQVILNLLMNAAQVSDSKESIEIIGAKDDEGHYVLTVLDRGPGIADADKKKVFEPFFTKRAGGSGLGLAVSSGLVRAHGGTITAEDREGGGTIFSIVLPIDRSEERSSS